MLVDLVLVLYLTSSVIFKLAHFFKFVAFDFHV